MGVLYKGYIYKYTFPNGKLYIGQTVRKVGRRFNEHLYSSQKNKGYYLHNAINKYGKNNILISIICTVGAITKEELKDLLNKLEVFFIQYYNSRVPNGYNVTIGGNSAIGYIVSEETKKKISEANKGHTLTEEQKTHLRQSLLGHKVSEETRRKIGEANRGRKCPEYVKELTSKRFKGVPFTDEHKRKLSEAQKGRIISEETRQKIRESQKTKKLQQLSISNEVIASYSCVDEASKQTNIGKAAIYKCTSGANKTAGGFKRKYINNN